MNHMLIKNLRIQFCLLVAIAQGIYDKHIFLIHNSHALPHMLSFAGDSYVWIRTTLNISKQSNLT